MPKRIYRCHRKIRDSGKGISYRRTLRIRLICQSLIQHPQPQPPLLRGVAPQPQPSLPLLQKRRIRMMKRIQLLLHPHIKMTSEFDVKWLSTAFNVILCPCAGCVTDFFRQPRMIHIRLYFQKPGLYTFLSKECQYP